MSGGATGREMRSALGRCGFVAGALHHVRPFLGPMFACASKIAVGTFARFPDAIRVLLEFVAEEIRNTSMERPTTRVADFVKEVFRVDAKAEGDHIVVGGWEIGQAGKKLRWFSVELNRKSAPWAYLRGEPFRNIALLELIAVVTAIILFGDDLADKGCRNQLTLSASTDNLGNMYVLQRFMSCKYPLSIVVMELARQLKVKGFEFVLG